MRQAHNTKTSQQQTMTPGLQQVIRILQLPTQELRDEIMKFLATNPMLIEDEAETRDISEIEIAEQDTGNSLNYDHKYYTYTTPYTQSNTANTYNEDFDIFSTIPETTSLQAHLIKQLDLLNLNYIERKICEFIVDHIGVDGYLTDTLRNIHEYTKRDIDLINVTLEEIEQMLWVVQNLEPSGVGARNVKESLLIQLSQYDYTSEVEAAIRIIESHLDSLINYKFSKIRKALQLDAGELEKQINLIKNLNPRPGSIFSNLVTNYIIPDVIIKKYNHTWQVNINKNNLPSIRVNEQYAQILKHNKNIHMQEQLSEARLLVGGIKNRHETLMTVVNQLLKMQPEFFEYGMSHLKPMVINDLAKQLNVHDSTISRATRQKYILTPHGVYELKDLFSSTISEDKSSHQIQLMIRRLINEEDKKKPLTDQDIVDKLALSNIAIARRTVTKYREVLNITSSSRRKHI